MPKTRIYIEPREIKNLIEIEDKNIVHKIRDVLRLKEKDELYVFNGEGKEYLYEIRRAGKKVILEKKKEEREVPLSSKKVTLGFPLLREDKIDFILQKATELGAMSFVPFISSRSLHIEPSISKIERWKRIVIESARQSGRLWVPRINNVIDFGGIIREDFSLKIAASIDGDGPRDVLDEEIKDILIIVGPEGDFSSQEYNRMREYGFKFIKLSPYILRVETAAIFAVGVIMQIIMEKAGGGRQVSL